ncbi:hypothetical protein C471_06138 [Halorubrum saccharovorum DSM 1137]|uniref:Uncharacterized protein n=1 Tax=Halorubrum saccharovorum DSM 1137 TaxID=1227484 RepID=M0E0V4_9EURY|nr:hypothetical protein [Halorubrum saccharovorum]ELZ41435.1 hypothetical protein C471_06138 [Halorubrum saccharovorum DSM 1137]
MDGTRVTVRCRDCSFAATYESLRDARAAVDDHESTTDHGVGWTIESLAAGVSQAGADAGVCGRPECANEDSPLVDPAPPETER